MRGILLFISLIAYSLVYSQSETFRATLSMNPEQAQTNELFEIIVEANVNGAINISFPDEFQIVNRTKHVQTTGGGMTVIVNGKPVQSGKTETVYIFKYVTRVSKKGTYVIKNGVFNHAKGNISLNNLTVKIVDAPPVSNSVKNNINKPFFGIISTSRNEVYVGEPVIVSSKIYSKGRITDVGDYEPMKIEGLAYKTDLFKDLNNLQVRNERVEGISFQTIKISEDLVIPQEAGEITCTPFSIQLGYQGNFFFTDYTNIVSGNARIRVLPLPTGAPKGFNGAVGKFDVTTSVASEALKEGDVFVYKIKIQGKGNLHLLSEPELNLPQAFELYGDPGKTEKVTIGAGGGEGFIEYEYTIQALESGNYDWSALQFAYFNPAERSYKSIEVPNIVLKVDKSEFSPTADGSIKRDVKIKGEGLRYIALESKNGEYYFLVDKYYFWLILILSPISAVFLGIYIRKRNLNRSEILATGMSKKASKLAQKELALAKSYWDKNELKAFAIEGHRAMSAFIARKMKCAPTELSREKLEVAFNAQQISTEIQTNWFDLMSKLEFIKFTSFVAQKEEDIPTQMSELITKIDESWS